MTMMNELRFVVEVLLEAIKCRALFHAINGALPAVSALYMHDMPSVDVSFVMKLVELADLTLTLSRDATVVAVANEQLVLELSDERWTPPPLADTTVSAIQKATANDLKNAPLEDEVKSWDRSLDSPDTTSSRPTKMLLKASRLQTATSSATRRDGPVRRTANLKSVSNPQQLAKQREKIRRATQIAVEATLDKSTKTLKGQTPPTKRAVAAAASSKTKRRSSSNASKSPASLARPLSEREQPVTRDDSIVTNKSHVETATSPVVVDHSFPPVVLLPQTGEASVVKKNKTSPRLGSNDGGDALATMAKCVVNDVLTVILTRPEHSVLLAGRGRSVVPTQGGDQQASTSLLVHPLHATPCHLTSPTTIPPVVPLNQQGEVVTFAQHLVMHILRDAIFHICQPNSTSRDVSSVQVLAQEVSTAAIKQGLQLLKIIPLQD
ncbi:hypothetical protein AaE_001163 [Aphanomyces astaci]|uniref:Uncharacterized protein n=1 Tax=Aphanomyces astaci TaxID=112090 RepID=A0A6A5ATT1_APHAT|nr:hypothetical protein AaE_001163 [Aphanomyces astaci]